MYEQSQAMTRSHARLPVSGYSQSSSEKRLPRPDDHGETGRPLSWALLTILSRTPCGFTGIRTTSLTGVKHEPLNFIAWVVGLGRWRLFARRLPVPNAASRVVAHVPPAIYRYRHNHHAHCCQVRPDGYPQIRREYGEHTDAGLNDRDRTDNTTNVQHTCHGVL